MTSEIKNNLDRLADIRHQLDVLAIDKDAAIKSVLSPEQRMKLAEIEAEYAEKAEFAQTNAKDIEAKVKAAVLEHGATVKSEHLQAVVSKPRVAYDSKALDGFAITCPEILAFRKEGKPTISIRK